MHCCLCTKSLYFFIRHIDHQWSCPNHHWRLTDPYLIIHPFTLTSLLFLFIPAFNRPGVLTPVCFLMSSPLQILDCSEWDNGILNDLYLQLWNEPLLPSPPFPPFPAHHQPHLAHACQTDYALISRRGNVSVGTDAGLLAHDDKWRQNSKLPASPQSPPPRCELLEPDTDSRNKAM